MPAISTTGCKFWKTTVAKSVGCSQHAGLSNERPPPTGQHEDKRNSIVHPTLPEAVLELGYDETTKSMIDNATWTTTRSAPRRCTIRTYSRVIRDAAPYEMLRQKRQRIWRTRPRNAERMHSHYSESNPTPRTANLLKVDYVGGRKDEGRTDNLTRHGVFIHQFSYFKLSKHSLYLEMESPMCFAAASEACMRRNAAKIHICCSIYKKTRNCESYWLTERTI